LRRSTHAAKTGSGGAAIIIFDAKGRLGHSREAHAIEEHQPRLLVAQIAVFLNFARVDRVDA
jgi:hypothetical protein